MGLAPSSFKLWDSIRIFDSLYNKQTQGIVCTRLNGRYNTGNHSFLNFIAQLSFRFVHKWMIMSQQQNDMRGYLTKLQHTKNSNFYFTILFPTNFFFLPCSLFPSFISSFPLFLGSDCHSCMTSVLAWPISLGYSVLNPFTQRKIATVFAS